MLVNRGNFNRKLEMKMKTKTACHILLLIKGKTSLTAFNHVQRCQSLGDSICYITTGCLCEALRKAQKPWIGLLLRKIAFGT